MKHRLPAAPAVCLSPDQAVKYKGTAVLYTVPVYPGARHLVQQYFKYAGWVDRLLPISFGVYISNYERLSKGYL